MRAVLILVATAALTLSGCMTPPATYQVSNSRSYAKQYDRLWEDTVAYFATRNIQIKNIAKDSGVIYAESAQFDNSMADCGQPGLWAIQGRRVNFNVFVTRSGEQPKVSVNSEFTEIRRFERDVRTFPCNSRGTLESSILDALAK